MEGKASWMGCVDEGFQEEGRAGFLGGAPRVSVPPPFQLVLPPDTPFWGPNMAFAEVFHKLALSHPCLDTRDQELPGSVCPLQAPNRDHWVYGDAGWAEWELS